MNRDDGAEYSVLIRSTINSTSDRIHLQYLKQLYNDVEIINDPDSLKTSANYINICFPNEIELEVGLSMLASKLTFDGKIAIKLYQTKNQLIVETN